MNNILKVEDIIQHSNGNSLAKYIDCEAVGKNFAINVNGRFTILVLNT